MSGFPGFPSGKLAYTPLPNVFFSELLPLIDDLAELKVTLHILWLLRHKKGTPCYVTLHELLADGTLLGGLQGLPLPAEQEVRHGLELAVARGTLLHLTTGDGTAHAYFLNSEAGRRAVDRIRLGEIQLPEGEPLAEPAVVVERPNIFTLYEQNIGLLQPIIAQELQEAEQLYPPQWVEEAFHIAVANNVRNWRYIQRILERWAAEGKDEGRGKTRERTWYTEEESRKFIQR